MTMISKDQFLELKHLKSLGVPTTTVAKKLGISVPSVNKWARMDEDAFENYLRNDTPYPMYWSTTRCISSTKPPITRIRSFSLRDHTQSSRPQRCSAGS